MKKFTCVQDIGDLKSAIEESFIIKKDRFKICRIGKKQDIDDDLLQLQSAYPPQHTESCA